MKSRFFFLALTLVCFAGANARAEDPMPTPGSKDATPGPVTTGQSSICPAYAKVDRETGETVLAGHARAYDTCKQMAAQSVCYVTFYDRCADAGGSVTEAPPSELLNGNLPPFTTDENATGFYSSCSIKLTCNKNQ